METAAQPAPELVQIDRLDLSHRLRPADPAHVHLLSQTLGDCPPIVVHRGSLRVVDGHMQVDAARLLGQAQLPVTWLEGDELALLEAAVSANSHHGLPLSVSQRKDAARRLQELAPQWSNRRIARACGLSESTVRRLRCPVPPLTQLDTRSGLDGKSYRLTNDAQHLARSLLASAPQQSDRAVARATGLSPTTVGRLRRDLGTRRRHPGPRALLQHVCRLVRFACRVLRLRL